MIPYSNARERMMLHALPIVENMGLLHLSAAFRGRLFGGIAAVQDHGLADYYLDLAAWTVELLLFPCFLLHEVEADMPSC